MAITTNAHYNISAYHTDTAQTTATSAPILAQVQGLPTDITVINVARAADHSAATASKLRTTFITERAANAQTGSPAESAVASGYESGLSAFPVPTFTTDSTSAQGMIQSALSAGSSQFPVPTEVTGPGTTSASVSGTSTAEATQTSDSASSTASNAASRKGPGAGTLVAMLAVSALAVVAAS